MESELFDRKATALVNLNNTNVMDFSVGILVFTRISKKIDRFSKNNRNRFASFLIENTEKQMKQTKIHRQRRINSTDNWSGTWNFRVAFNAISGIDNVVGLGRSELSRRKRWTTMMKKIRFTLWRSLERSNFLDKDNRLTRPNDLCTKLYWKISNWRENFNIEVHQNERTWSSNVKRAKEIWSISLDERCTTLLNFFYIFDRYVDTLSSATYTKVDSMNLNHHENKQWRNPM